MSAPMPSQPSGFLTSSGYALHLPNSFENATLTEMLVANDASVHEGTIIIPCYTWKWVWYLLKDMLAAKDARVCDILMDLKDIDISDDVQVRGEIVSKGDYNMVNISTHCDNLKSKLVTILINEVSELKPAYTSDSV